MVPDLFSVHGAENKSGTIFIFDLTHNYTGDQGPRDSPHLYKSLVNPGLAEAHRYLSERGIIAVTGPRSTSIFKYSGIVRA